MTNEQNQHPIILEKIEFYYHRIFDLKGSFSFSANGLVISSFAQKLLVSYLNISGVSRQFYNHTKAIVNITVSQANPNKYCIELKDGRKIEFCVAHKEEDSYQKAIEQLRRKIYGFNRLGVGFTSKVKSVPAYTRQQQDRQFELERPQRNFSLEKAIASLLRHCDLELDDQTEYEGHES